MGGKGGRATDHIAGALESSGVTCHLLTSHSLGDPPSLSQNLEDSLGMEIPVSRVPGEGKAIGLNHLGSTGPWVGRGVPNKARDTTEAGFSVDLA